MVWPGVSDYQEAVQTPRLCFFDDELKSGSPVLTKLGLPRPISGGNASVYQIRSGRREFAVRCFLRDVPELRQRYAAIDRHLRDSKLRASVGFEYQQEGIRFRGKPYPVLKMEWVRGVPLNDYVAKIVSDAKALRRLADAWQKLMGELARAKIAHGDLQHGNVLIADGEIILIDYDGMWVPALAGQPGLELGHASFQHPQRAGSDFGPDVDRFSALVIHVALLALAERPQMWATYDNADNLLFTRDDFADPDDSALFKELEQCKDKDLLAEVHALRASCKGSFAGVPALKDAVAAGRRAGPPPAVKPQATPAPAPAAPKPAAAQPAPAPATGSKGNNKLSKKKARQLARAQANQANQANQAKQSPPAPPANQAKQQNQPSKVNQANSQPNQGKSNQTKGGVLPIANAPAGGGKPGWLASAMATAAPAQPSASASASASAPAPAAGGGTVNISQAWRYGPIAVTRRTAAHLAGRARAGERALVLTVLAVLVNLVVFVIDRAAVLVSMVVTFALWLRARRRSRRRAAPPSGLLPTAALTADGQGVAVIEASGAVAVLDPDNGAPKHRLTADGGVPMGIVALGGGRCATLGADGQLRVHDAAGAIAHRSSQPRATCMGGAPGGSLIAFGTADHKVRVVGQDGKERCTLAGHTDAVTAVAIARDQQQLVSGGADHAVRLWSLASSSCEHVLSGATATITAVALGGNGRFVAAGCADGNSVVWDARHQKLLHVVRTGNGPVRALAFAPDAALLFAAGADRAIHCIDAASGQVLGRVAGLAAPAVVLAISNDGARIVSADTDGQVVAWMRRARPSGVKTPQLQSAGAP